MAVCWQMNWQHMVEGVTRQQMERVGKVKRKQIIKEMHDDYNISATDTTNVKPTENA